MSEKWADAVRQAGEDSPADASAAIREELISLWSDLDYAVSHAIHGWSMECDWLTVRIVRLSRIAGATPWDEIPGPLLLDGTYPGILAAAGITCNEHNMYAIRKWRDNQ